MIRADKAAVMRDIDAITTRLTSGASTISRECRRYKLSPRSLWVCLAGRLDPHEYRQCRRKRFGIVGNAPGPEAWPYNGLEDPQAAKQKHLRAINYHDDVMAGRPIRWIEAGIRLEGV